MIDGTYENNFFGISWDIPETWTYDDTYAQQWTKAANLDIYRLAQSSYESKFRIKMPPQQVKESLVFQLSKFKPETIGSNPVIILYAEQFATIEGSDVQDMDDYMVQTVKEASNTAQMTLDSEDYETDHIGGTKFYKLTGSVNEGDRKRLQRYYTTEINGFGLTFILSAADKTGLEELEDVFRTVSL